MIETKRRQLEQFIEEQIIGPGISAYRFIDISDGRLRNKISELRPIDYRNELINVVPAGVYSSGILFPVDNSKTDDGLANLHDKEQVPDGDDLSKDNDEDSIEDYDPIQIDQMYPNTMGLTCCMSDEILETNILKIRIEGRYYSKLESKDSTYSSKFGVLCECDPEKVKRVISNTILNNKIKFIALGPNTVICCQDLNPADLTEIKNEIRSLSEAKVDEIFHTLQDFNFELKTKSISALKQICYYELKRNCTESRQQRILYEASQEIESLENAISHISDLIDLFDSRSYGLWQSNSLDIEVPFPGDLPKEINGKTVYSYRKYENLKEICSFKLKNGNQASLSLNLQLSRDSRKQNSKIFFKVQLVNTSTPFIKEPDDARYYSTFNEEINTRCFFGVKISITNPSLIPYNTIEMTDGKDTFDEDDITKFIYRQFDDYGIGHGCSIKWQVDEQAKIVTVSTEYIPKCDTPDVDFIPRNKELFIERKKGFESALFMSSNRSLEFKWLSIFSDANPIEIISSLEEFVNAYAKWIDLKRAKYNSESELTASLANAELDKCMADKDRMLRNIGVFLKGQSNTSNLTAFRLMNAVMFMQLWHSVKVKTDEVKSIIGSPDFESFDFTFYKLASDKLFGTENASWRPFQLAFILLNLDGVFPDINDPTWKRRNEYVDLVWFPTGGGKTEAYLGIIALTIIYRRTTFGPQGGGTAAIMRYTLRLLTLQQFQRATLMIMALELLRRWGNHNLGIDEPIFIGLWVGDNSLPNRMEPNSETDKNNLLTEFRKLAQGGKSKIPYDKCPWCSSKLNPSQQVEKSPNDFHYNRLHLKCSNEKCSFSFNRPGRARKDQGPIPVSLCDEEIYQHPPALLFGTVDKFAQLAHKVSDNPKQRHKDSRRLFGKGNWESKKPQGGYLPPDLIIQDELHLLLGPLGSSVALFESAIDQLCTRDNGIRPKIISSTATTRNTNLQIMALFDRQVNLFPKPGVECDDSFFSFYRRSFDDGKGAGQKYLSKRRYMGILPTGRTQIWMQMRLAAVLATHRAIFEIQQLGPNGPFDFESYKGFEKAMDYYHTTISYFNSLKEVGKTESQIHSYIIKEIRRVFNRAVRPCKLAHSLYTYAIRKGELTGRLSGEEVKNELDKVQSHWSPKERFATKTADGIIGGHVPPDFVVATNMISVGIDVPRFNLIIMNSMPRNIAEYIQASSRVARDSYGLVLTVHHPFRARDMSHYEKFVEFHEKMYSYVEPISITPFTKKAIERYLGLYLATILRHTARQFTNRDSANSISGFSEKQITDFIHSFYSYFENRKLHLDNSPTDINVKQLLREENVQSIKKWINSALTEWRTFSDEVGGSNKALVFSNKKKVLAPRRQQEQLYVDIDEYEGNIHSEKWQVPMSLRVIEPEASIKIKLK